MLSLLSKGQPMIDHLEGEPQADESNQATPAGSEAKGREGSPRSTSAGQGTGLSSWQTFKLNQQAEGAFNPAQLAMFLLELQNTNHLPSDYARSYLAAQISLRVGQDPDAASDFTKAQLHGLLRPSLMSTLDSIADDMLTILSRKDLHQISLDHFVLPTYWCQLIQKELKGWEKREDGRVYRELLKRRASVAEDQDDDTGDWKTKPLPQKLTAMEELMLFKGERERREKKVSPTSSSGRTRTATASRTRA